MTEIVLHLCLLLALPPLLSGSSPAQVWFARAQGAAALAVLPRLCESFWHKGAVYSRTTTGCSAPVPIVTLAAALAAGLSHPLS